MTQVKQFRRKFTTLTDIYMRYPYKKNKPHTENTIPIPYIKQNDISSHSYTLDCVQWLDVIERYLNHEKEEMLLGKKLEPPCKIGYLRIVKIKGGRKLIDYKKSKEQGKQVFTDGRSLNDGGCVFKLTWLSPRKTTKLRFRFLWQPVLVRSYIKQYYKHHEDDYTFNNRFLELVKYD